MSLNDIHLSSTLIVDLYKNSLIESTNTSTDQIKQSKNSISFLGNNKNQVVILVHYEDAVHIPDDQLNFLTTILVACKLSMNDIAIVNLHRTGSIEFKELFKVTPAKSVILFDVLPETILLPINFPQFQVQSFDGINYLTSPSLDQIEKNKSLKMELWTSLKKLFKL